MSGPTAANVLVGQATIYYSPSNTAAPTVQASGAFGPLSNPWVQIGFTEGGLTFSVDAKNNPIMVEEQSTPVLVVPDTLNVELGFELAEDILANMQLAYGRGTLATTAPTASTYGWQTLSLSDTLLTNALFFSGVNSFGYQRGVYVPEVFATGKVQTKYRRAKQNRSYPCTFTAVCAPSAIQIIEVNAPPS